MPAQAGIHDFLYCGKGKSWMPVCAGMTKCARRRWINLFDDWNDTRRPKC
jgi:hypothetical protein